MKPIQYYTKELLELAYSAMGDVSENVFAEQRPMAIPAQIDDMVVVSIPYGFRNKNVLQTALLRVELIVRNKENGVVNVEKLQDMLDMVTGMMPLKEGRFFISSPTLALRGDDGAGFTIWCVHCNVEVNTLDRYE